MSKKNPKIPGLFHYLSKNNSAAIPLYPLEFSIDGEKAGRFDLASKHIPLNSFKPRRFDINLQGVERRNVKYRHMRDYPLLVSNKGMVVVGPILNEFAQTIRSDGSVASSLGKLGLSHASSTSSPGFGLMIESTSATIGPAVENSLIDPPNGEYGFLEYVFMADQDKNDRLLLLAGLGYLAGLAVLKQN